MVTAISTLIPSMVEDIGGIALVPWNFALYDMGSIVASAGCGLLVYRYQMRLPLCVAAIVFAAGSVICALTAWMPVVVLGRLLQGLGGGGLIAIAFIGISSLFPERLIPRAMGAVSAIWGASAFLGPLIGAFFAQQLSWRAAFWFFAVMSIGLALWIRAGVTTATQKAASQTAGRFPIRRLLVLSAGVLLIAAGGIDISPVKTSLFVLAGIGFLAGFIQMDGARDDSRLLPRRPIGFLHPVSAGLTMILCFTMAATVITVYGPLFIVKLHDVSIIKAGYIVACSSIGWSLCAVLIAGIHPNWDRLAIVAGMMMLTASMIGFVFFIAQGPIILLAFLALVEGGGFGLAWGSILRHMLVQMESDDRERVSAAIPTIQRLGYAVGAAWIGIVANASGLALDVDAETLGTIAQWVFLACLPFALLGLIATWRFVRQ